MVFERWTPTVGVISVTYRQYTFMLSFLRLLILYFLFGIYSTLSFQTMVLPAYSPELLRGPQRRDDLVAEYFNQGYTNNGIVFALVSTHGVRISLATLKRILQRLGLRRRHNTMSPIHDIIGAIFDIIEYSGQCIGYRTVWKRPCSQYNMRVTRNEVMKLMGVIDGQAVERRRKRRLFRHRYMSTPKLCMAHRRL